jgi:hypothetical protein
MSCQRVDRDRATGLLSVPDGTLMADKPCHLKHIEATEKEERLKMLVSPQRTPPF